MGTMLEFKPEIIGFLCNWCCYAGADLCGVSRFQYPPYIKVIRVMCSGRVDLSFILRAFLNGKDGVFMGGCWPGECHYVTEGNYLAISTMHPFVMSQMMALLREKPRTIGELSGILGISPSEASRHLNLTARQGLDIFDESQNRIAAALTESAVSEPEKGRGMAATASPNSDKIHQLIDTHQGKPGSLIHVLMEIQSENHWLPKEILNKVSEKLKVPLSRVMQIATFYKIFSLTPKGRHEVQVCTGTSCHPRGASHLLASFEDLTGIRPGETDANSTFSLESGNCLGCCTLGPEIIVDGTHHGRITPAAVGDILKNFN